MIYGRISGLDKEVSQIVLGGFSHDNMDLVNSKLEAFLAAGGNAVDTGSKEAWNRKELTSFLNNPRVFLDQVTETTAEFYADIYLRLRSKGTPIPANDMWIAASAMEHGCALYSLDRHFRMVDGLLRI
jgi:predicted nucleic acid-binding protein